MRETTQGSGRRSSTGYSRGGPPIPRIDAHIHAFPERLALAVRGRLDAAGRLTSSPHLPEIATEVQAAGFDRAWVLPYAHRAGVAETLNEWVATEVARYPWLIPGGSFHPDDETFPALVKHAFTGLGIRVVKFHCSVGAYSPADPRLRPLWAAAASEGVPILIHVGQNSPGNTDASELEALGPVLDAHPRLSIVLAHTGHPAIEAALTLMARHDNLYADVTPVWLNEIKVAPDTLEAYAGRFLFGSDAPNNPTSVSDQVARFASMDLSAHALTMLMGGSAAGLIPTT